MEWLAFSQIGVTDLPLAATFSAAMLLALPWVANGDTRWLPWAGAFLGLAVLAKGLVPLALAAPLALALWKRPAADSARALVRLGLPLLVVALPWYLLCYRANGMAFLHDFFWVHHFERLTSAGADARRAVVVLRQGAGGGAGSLDAAAGRRRRVPRFTGTAAGSFCCCWCFGGLLFFSAPLNKLPGYLMPLLPIAAALLGIALEQTRRAALVLAACALLLAAFPVMAPVLPAAIASGLSKAPFPPFQSVWLLPLALAGAVWLLEIRQLAYGRGVLYCRRSGQRAWSI